MHGDTPLFHPAYHYPACLPAAQPGDTPLYTASQEGHDKVVELLLAEGAILNQAKKV